MQKLYFVIELYCIVLFLEQIKKKEKKPTTQYNTITQYNLVKFKDFLRKLYCVIELYCIVLFLEQIKKKKKKTNNTIQHNNTIQFGKI